MLKRLKHPQGLALAIFLALAVFGIGQISWWIYYQVVSEEEQLQFNKHQARQTAAITAFHLNQEYNSLAPTYSVYLSGQKRLKYSNLTSESLHRPVLGATVMNERGEVVWTVGDIDTTWYLQVATIDDGQALVWLDRDYPMTLLDRFAPDLTIDKSVLQGELQTDHFQADDMMLRPEVIEEMEDEAHSHVVMFASEGSFFVLLMLLGAFMIYRALRQTEQTKQQQENFIQAVTHELKIPVASIKLYLETLSGGKVAPEKTRTFIPKMLEDCQRLEGMVDNVLEAGRLSRQARKMKLIRTNLSTDLHEYLEELQPMFQRYDLKTETSIEPGIHAKTDYHAMRRVVTALADNAIKYSHPDRKELIISLKKVNSECEMRFDDKGVGIERDEQERVFERFYRTGEEKTRSVKGTGIGLFLVKQIVNEHGGSVRIESEGRDRGTSIIIRLPIDNSE